MNAISQLVVELHRTLGARQVTLVRPVVRLDRLVVGGWMSVSADGLRSEYLGRPLGDVVGIGDREKLLERYHLDGGGAFGAMEPVRAGIGLQPLLGPHILAPEPPGGGTSFGAWLVFEASALGFVAAWDPTEDVDSPDVERAVRFLRRALARSIASEAGQPTGTGFVDVDEHGALRAADRRGMAWMAARGAEDPEPVEAGVHGGTLVVPSSLQGERSVQLTTVRPVRAPMAPVGLCLTEMQREVAGFLGSSATLAEIAAARGCRPSTVQRHRDRIDRALEVAHRVELGQRLRAI